MAATLESGLTAAGLRCEYRNDPLGIDASQPRLSWIVTSTGRGQKQTAYQVLVAGDEATLSHDQGDLWDSGQVESDETTCITLRGKAAGIAPAVLLEGRRSGTRTASPRPGAPRRSGRWDCWTRPTGKASGSALTSPAMPCRPLPPPLTRKGQTHQADPAPAHLSANQFQVEKPVRRATVYATALGIFDLHLNGQRVSDDYFNPGWTDYTRRVYYRAYDVTSRVRPGANALGAILADGWYSGYVGFGKMRDHYGKHPRLRAMLHLEYTDGTTDDIATGPELESRHRPHPRGRLPDGRNLRRPAGHARLGHARIRRWQLATRGPWAPR